jgi:hypothetical protein
VKLDHRIRRSEVWARWLVLADEMGLPPGDPTRLKLAPDPALHGPAQVDEALDWLVALARRPRWQLDAARLAIEADPRGSFHLARLAAELDWLARADYRRRAVAEFHAGRLPAVRVARRWGINRATLFRWAAEVHGVAISAPDATVRAESFANAGPVRAPMSRSHGDRRDVAWRGRRGPSK